jgi:hypothetical protein
MSIVCKRAQVSANYISARRSVTDAIRRHILPRAMAGLYGQMQHITGGPLLDYPSIFVCLLVHVACLIAHTCAAHWTCSPSIWKCINGRHYVCCATRTRRRIHLESLAWTCSRSTQNPHTNRPTWSNACECLTSYGYLCPSCSQP